MCQRIAFVLLAAVFVFLTGAAAAFVYLEWWQAILASAALFAAVVLATKAVIKFMIRRAFGGDGSFGGGLGGMMSGMFKAKGAALKNATATVHSVVPTNPPPEVPEGRDVDDEDDDGDGDEDSSEALESTENGPPKVLKWYAFDVTISPEGVEPPRSADTKQNRKFDWPAGSGRDRREKFTMWDIDDLVLVPSDAVFGEGLEDLGEADEFALENVRIVVGDTAKAFDEDKVSGPRRLRFTAGINEGVRAVKFRYYFEGFGHIPLPQPS